MDGQDPSVDESHEKKSDEIKDDKEQIVQKQGS